MSNENFELELRIRFGQQYPTCSRAIGINEDGSIRYMREYYDGDASRISRSGGSGHLNYFLTPGLYCFDELTTKAYERSEGYILVKSGTEVDHFKTEDEFKAECFRAFKADAAVAKAYMAQQNAIQTAIVEALQMLEDAYPDPDEESITILDKTVQVYAIRKIPEQNHSASVTEMLKTAETGYAAYACGQKFEDQSYDDLIEKVRGFIQSQKIELEKAEEGMKLPDLTGSPKQIAWAKDIRAKVLAKDPKHRSLRKATRAKYWIENRNSFH